MKTMGFSELEHTADWALRVWAPDLPNLFEQAARGMYALMEAPIDEQSPHASHQMEIQGSDAESLLVAFLAELLYLADRQGLAFNQFNLDVWPDHLHAWLEGGPFTSQRKEIKAVTYHNLAIKQREDGLLEVAIVFDV